jgi:DnaK suppressor protein
VKPAAAKPAVAKPAASKPVAAKAPAAPTPAAAPAPAARPAAPAPKAPARTAPPVVATGISRGTLQRPQVDATDGEDGEETSSLLAGPRNVQPYIAKRGEQYMNREQLDHFRNILQSWKRDLMVEVDRTVTHMKDEAANFPDPNDRATQEEEFSLELRTRDRERKLIRKIDEALKRIEDGSYGYCLETGEEIGIKRLEARPVATLSIEAQERRERRERQYGDRDDRYR